MQFSGAMNKISQFPNSLGYSKFISWILIIILIIGIFQLYNIATETAVIDIPDKHNDFISNFPILPTDFGNEMLVNYHMLGCYHAASNNNLTRDVVSISALENRMKSGVRFIHLQVFSIKHQPVVSVATDPTGSRKSVFNHLKLSEVFHTIYERGFSASLANNNDPLFLYLEIMSERKQLFDDIADIFFKQFKERILDNKYGEGGQLAFKDGRPIEHLPMKEFKGKIVLVVREKGHTLCQSDLYSVTNIIVGKGGYDTRVVCDPNGSGSSGSSDILIMTHKNIRGETSSNKKDMKSNTKQLFSIATPDLKESVNTNKMHQSMNYGFNAICFYMQKYNYADFLELMTKFSDDSSNSGKEYFAFKLKDETLRSKTIYVSSTETSDDRTEPDNTYNLMGLTKTMTNP